MKRLFAAAALAAATIIAPALLLAAGNADTGTAADATAGTFRLVTQATVQTDPAFISSEGEVALANAIYDYLVDVDHDNIVQPRLADSWSVSADGLAYTFDLADNVSFHDGSAFSSADVVWTFDRLRDAETGSPTVDLYKNIVSVAANGPDTVVFRLADTNPFFLFDLSDNHALIVKDGTSDATDFNGTGPFRMVNYIAEDRAEMAANQDYHGNVPGVATYEIVFFADEAASIDALKSDQVDMVFGMSSAVLETLEGERGINTVAVSTNAFDLFRIRSDRAPGNDPRVIKAFRMAVDREEIRQKVTLGNGGIGNDTPIGPLYADYHVPSTFTQDIPAARQLLADAGYGDGMEIDLHAPNSGTRPDYAVLLKEQLAAIGVNVNVIIEPESVYYDSGNPNNWLAADFGITSWGSRPIPQFYLDVMMVSGANWNEAHFSDAEADRLAALAGSTLDEEERKTAYADLQALLFDRGPFIISYFFPQTAAIRDRFTGLNLKAFPGRTDFTALRIQ
jgi:peptide/nickel transport system substrate-binding protein